MFEKRGHCGGNAISLLPGVVLGASGAIRFLSEVVFSWGDQLIARGSFPLTARNMR